MYDISNNFIVGRIFGFKMIDMIEFGVKLYFPLTQKFLNHSVRNTLIIFAGQELNSGFENRMVRSLLVAIFKTNEVISVILNNLHHITSVLFFEGKILLRRYRIVIKRTIEFGNTVELIDGGPIIDLTLRRYIQASKEMAKLVMLKS